MTSWNFNFRDVKSCRICGNSSVVFEVERDGELCWRHFIEHCIHTYTSDNQFKYSKWETVEHISGFKCDIINQFVNKKSENWYRVERKNGEYYTIKESALSKINNSELKKAGDKYE